MQLLKQFSLPLQGLKIGTHSFSFEIDKAFFAAFERSPYRSGSIAAHAALEKKTDHMVLNVNYDGSIELDCDRCTDLIDFPVTGSSEMLIKFSEDEREEEEVIYINPDAPQFNCAKVFYDAIILGLPLNKTCDEVEDKSCNPDVIALLDRREENEIEKETVLSQALKGLNINKN